MTGGGLSRFANRGKPGSGSAGAAVASAASKPPGNGAAKADSAAVRGASPASSSTTLMKDGAGVSQFGMYAGFEGIDYGFGGGMADYGNPFLHAEHGSMYAESEVIQGKASEPKAPAASQQENNPPGPCSGRFAQQQGVVKTPIEEGSHMKGETVLPSSAPSPAPAGTSFSVVHGKVPDGLESNSLGDDSTVQSGDASAATASDVFHRYKLKLAPRSNILFTPRPQGQPMMRLVPDPASLTKVLPSPPMTAARRGMGQEPGGASPRESVASEEGAIPTGGANVTPIREGQGQTMTPRGSILKTSRYAGGQGDPNLAGRGRPPAALTPPPTGPPGGAFGSLTASGTAHHTPALVERSNELTPPDRIGAAVTPGSSALTSKKTVTFDPKNLTETFLIPRVLPEPLPMDAALETEVDLDMSPGASDPPTDPIGGDEVFCFDDVHESFLMNCRDSMDQVKIMNDEILDLNVYLDSMRADFLVMEAEMMDLHEDAEGLCNKYDDLLGFLSDNFPDID